MATSVSLNRYFAENSRWVPLICSFGHCYTGTQFLGQRLAGGGGGGGGGGSGSGSGSGKTLFKCQMF